MSVGEGNAKRRRPSEIRQLHRWSYRSPVSGEYLPTENPYSGNVWALIARGGEGDVAVVAAAASARWAKANGRGCRATQRGHLLWRLGDLIIANAERLAAIEQRDNGKIMSEVTAQIRYMGDYFKYYARPCGQGARLGDPDRQARRLHLHQARTQGRGRHHHAVEFAADAHQLEARAGARRRRHGHHQAVRVHFGVDARIRTALCRGGLSQRRRQRCHGAGAEVGAALVSHPAVAHVGFTGGDAAGRKIYQLAAAGLKTVTLELGGKSPNIVFDDADLDQAVKGVVSGIFAASGQSCQAGSRLLLQRSIHDRFVES